MTPTESKSIVNRIKIFRPTFRNGNTDEEKKEFISEWHKILKDYNYEDVSGELEKFFKQSSNYGKIPEIHLLVKNLEKEKDKKLNTNNTTYVYCKICKKKRGPERRT